MSMVYNPSGETRPLGLSPPLGLFKGEPESLIETGPVYFLPSAFCLYDSTGLRIPESCVWRGPGLNETVNAGNPKIKIPVRYQSIEEPTVFLGHIPNHWGHFLTEGINRLWALQKYPWLRGYRFVYTGPPSHIAAVRRFLELANVHTDRLTCLQEVVLLSRCFIPPVSFANRCMAYTVHSAIPRAIASRVVRAGASIPPADSVVYLSRVLWKPDGVRIIRNEAILQRVLAERGIIVVHPQRLPLDDQVRLFNTHKHFLGCWGSAFHNSIFSLQGRKLKLHVICGTPHANSLLFDAIAETRTVYIRALKRTPKASQAWPVLDLQIDIDTVIKYLEKHLII